MQIRVCLTVMEAAFYQCTQLTTVNRGEGIEGIGNEAFAEFT
jgi:hypothetical protein